MQLPVQTDSSEVSHARQEAVIAFTKSGDLGAIQTLVNANLVVFHKDPVIPTLCFVNAVDRQKNLLHYALEAGHQDLAIYYCKNLPYDLLSGTTSHGESCLYLAIDRDFDEVIKLLLEANVSILTETRIYQETPLREAIKKRKLDLVKKLVAKLKDDLQIRDLSEYAGHSNYYNRSGDTILHLAVEKNHPEMVAFLIEQKMMVDVINLTGTTPLLLACVNGYTEVAKILLLNKANPNISNHKNVSALEYAVGIENEELVKVLLENGAVIKRKNANPLSLTHPRIISLLFRYGAAIGENYSAVIAQLAPIIHSNGCLFLGTRINDKPIAEIKPLIFTDGIFDNQKIPLSSLGDRTQENSILRCCQYAVNNATLAPAAFQTISSLLTTRGIKIVGLRHMLLHLLKDESFCQRVINETKNVEKTFVNVPRDLKEQMATFFSVLSRKNTIEAIVQPITERQQSFLNREYLDNLIALENEILRFKDDIKATYHVHHKTNIALLTLTSILFFGLCVLAAVYYMLEQPPKVDHDQVATDMFKLIGILFAEVLFSVLMISSLYFFCNLKCSVSELPLTRLQPQHQTSVQKLKAWLDEFAAEESQDRDESIESSLREWKEISNQICNSADIKSLYESTLIRIKDQMSRDKPLIHSHFTKYSQFFKPYAKIPSFFSDASEQLFEFDIENNQLTV